MQDMQPQDTNNALPNGEVDREGAMAKADLYKLANYSLKLFKKVGDDDQLEAWVQAKITKAADYIASVYHYLEYEMKFSEYGEHLANAEVYAEGVSPELRNKLMEAKEKVAELKKLQAKKKQMDEGVLSGGERACTECGGTGMVYEEPKAVPAHVKSKVEKYKRLTKATHAAHKRLDANNNGIPDEDEMEEEMSSTGGTITRPSKGVLRHKENTKRFSDEPHAEPASKAKAQSASDKAGDKAADKAEEKEGKAWEKAHGAGSVTRVKDGKKQEPGAKKEKEVDETYGQGVYESEMKVGATKKTRTGVLTKTATGVKHTNTSFKDEEHAEPASKVKARSAADKAGEKAQDKADEKSSKAYEKAHPGTVSRYKDGKKVNEAAKPDYIDADDDGDEKESMKKAFADKKKAPFKKVKEELKGNQKKLDADDDGDIEADDLADLRASKKVKEATGDYSAKKGAAGKDLGKPGKNFAKIAKGAGGGEKGEKIAGAVLKNLRKESVEVEAIAESADVARLRELTGRLNLNENVINKSANEVDQLRALTKRLNG